MPNMWTIKKLNSEDYEEILSVLNEEPLLNFFQIAYLKTLFEEQSIVTYFGQYKNGSLVSVFMKFHKLWYFSKAEVSTYEDILTFIQKLNEPKMILNDTSDFFEETMLNDTYKTALKVNGELLILEEVLEKQDYSDVRLATELDVEKMVHFYANAPTDVKRGRDSIVRSLDNGRRTYLISRGEEIDTIALTTGETESIAMIGGLHYLHDPYALKCVLGKLVEVLRSENKTACVVVRNPIIKNVCREIGFVKYRDWHMYHIEHV